jgi:hypothetical protein
MTVSEIAKFCCQTTGDISSEAIEFAKDAIRLKYSVLYDAHSWREAQRTIGPILLDPALGGAFFLPFDCEETLFVSISYDSTNFMRLDYRERDWLERFGASMFTIPGNSPFYYRAENLAWPTLNPGIFTFTSSDRSGVTVYIEGRDSNDYPIAETFSLQGTLLPDGTIAAASISTAKTYAVVTVLSKTAGTTPLTIQTATGPAPVIMPPNLNQMVFTQLRLAPPPILINQDNSTNNVWVRAQVKLKADTLDNDMSVPRISHIWDALIEFTLSSLYTKYRQLQKADAREQKAMLHVQAAVNVEKDQSEFRQQVVPVVYDSGDYLAEIVGRVTSYRPFG